MSTQSIASSSRDAEIAEPCRRCGAPLADDQRYCLQCGERRAPMSSTLLGGQALSGPPGSPAAPAPVAAPPAVPPGHAPPPAPARGNAVVLLAGVGVLMLAMGVGVLIGRSVAPSQSSGQAPVINLATTPGSGAASTTPASEFTDDWPASTSGYTLELQELPQASTTASAVTQAKAAASAKGAPAVGALRSEDFQSLTAGSFIIYSGVYHTKAQAEKALAALKKSFPGASVIKVSGAAALSPAGASAAGASGSPSSRGSGGGSKASNPASTPGGSKKSGRSYEQESKNLPNVVTTG